MSVGNGRDALLVALVGIAAVGACSAPRGVPVLHTKPGPEELRASFAGIELSAPSTWKAVHGSPPVCGDAKPDIRTAYFYVQPNSPPPGCSSGGDPVAPYLVVECHPFGATPTGSMTRLGPFAALIVASDSSSAFFFIPGKDAIIAIHGGAALQRQIEQSVEQTDGSC